MDVGSSGKARRTGAWWGRGVAFAALFVVSVLAGVAAALYGRLERGGLSLDFLAPGIERSLSESLGEGRRVTIASAGIARDDDGRFVVEAAGVAVRDGDGRLVAQVPRARIALNGNPLIGTSSVSRIDLSGAALAIKINDQGLMALAAPAPRAPGTPPAAGAEPELTPFRRLGVWLDLIERSGLDGAKLSALGLRGGSVIIDDARTGQHAVFTGVDLDMTTPAEGGASLKLTSTSGAARWTVTATASRREEGGGRALDVVVDNVPPRDLMLAFDRPLVVSAETAISGVWRATLDQEGKLAVFSGSVSLGRGEIGRLDDPAHRLTLDAAVADFSWTPEGPGLLIERFEASAGEERLDLAAVIHPVRDETAPLRVDIVAARAVTRLANPTEAAAQIGLRNAQLAYDRAARTLRIDGAEFTADGVGVIRLAGVLDFNGATPGLDFGLASSPMPLAAYLRLWPAVVAGPVRDWVVRHVSAGIVDASTIAVRIPPGGLAPGATPLTEANFSLDGSLRAVVMTPVPGVPPLKDAELALKIDGVKAEIRVPRATLETTPSRRLSLTQGAFDIADHRLPIPRLQSRFRLEGPAEAAFDLLQSDALKAGSGLPPLPSGAVRGTVVAQVSLATLLREKPQRGDVEWRVEADASGFGAEKAFGDMRLENATVKAVATARDLTMRGEGRLGGAQATFEFRRARPDAKPEIRLAAVLDDAGRARLGLDVGARIAGPTPVRVVTQEAASPRYQVEADLTQAVLNDLIPGWVKPRGQAARARFIASETDDGWRLDDLVVESRGVLVRGSLRIDEGGSVISGAFPAFHLSDGDRADLKVERAGDGHKVTIRGDVIDARPMLRALTEPPRAGAGRDNARPRDVEVDVRAGAVVGANGEVLRQLELRLARRANVMRAFAASGRLGRNEAFTVELRGQGGQQQIAATVGDAGALLRFLDLYPTLQGGRMTLTMSPIGADGAIRDGSVEISNFAIRNDRAIAGMIAAARDNDRAAPRTEPGMDTGSFSRLRAEFTRADGRISITNGLLWGSTIGATVEGEFDLARDRLKLAGTYVPAYALNNLFARIPVLGFFIGGAPDEGLIGITYEIAGKVSEPRLTINPLSAVTPGFLRKLFEFRGRSVVRPDEATGSTR